MAQIDLDVRPSPAQRIRRASNGPVVSRWFRRRLWSPESNRTLADAVALQHREYDRAIPLVRIFYAISAYWVLGAINRWPNYRNSHALDPLWPVHWWFEHVSVSTGVDIILTAYVVTGIVVALLPELRVARAAYAIALLQFGALQSTPDKVLGDLDLWVFLAIFLVFLPRGPWGALRGTAQRQYFLMVIWSALLFVLFLYTLAGWWKIHDAAFAFVHGHPSGFNPSGFSYIVGQRIEQTNQTALFARFFSLHELPGWPLFLGTMYVEFCSVIIAFRPRLHRLWGVALIAFHLGTQLIMGFTFPQNIVVFGLFLVCSPFAPDRIDLKDALLDLPGLHFVVGRVRAFRRRMIHRRVPAPTAERQPEPAM